MSTPESRGDKTQGVPSSSKSRGDMSPCPPMDLCPCICHIGCGLWLHSACDCQQLSEVPPVLSAQMNIFNVCICNRYKSRNFAVLDSTNNFPSVSCNNTVNLLCITTNVINLISTSRKCSVISTFNAVQFCCCHPSTVR